MPDAPGLEDRMPTSPEGFSERIESLRVSLFEQGRRVQALLELAFNGLFQRDIEQAKRCVEADDEIDRVDVELERAAVALLSDAVKQGASLDHDQLRMVLTIVKCNNELERVADCAVEIAELAAHMRSLASPLPDTFRVMANSSVGILRDTCACIQKKDALLAKVVLQSQHAVTAFKDAVLRDAEERIAKGQMSVDFAFRLHEVATVCEVVADHCTNMAEQIIYSTTGAIVRHTEAKWIELPRS